MPNKLPKMIHPIGEGGREERLPLANGEDKKVAHALRPPTKVARKVDLKKQKLAMLGKHF